MMKRTLLLAIVAIASVANVWGQSHPEPYLKDGLSDYDFILPPPSLTSGEFAYDFYHYQHGREMREMENYFYNREAMQSFKFPADMWNSPIICFNMTRVKDRGDNDYSLTTEDGLNLIPVNLVTYVYDKESDVAEFEDGVRPSQHLIYTQFDLVKVNGVKYSPYWTAVEDKER